MPERDVERAVQLQECEAPVAGAGHEAQGQVPRGKPSLVIVTIGLSSEHSVS